MQTNYTLDNDLKDVMKKLVDDKTRFIVDKTKSYFVKIENTNISNIVENDSLESNIDLINKRRRLARNVDLIDSANVLSNINKMRKLTKYKNKPFYESFPKPKVVNLRYKTDRSLLNYTKEDLIDVAYEVVRNIKELKKDKYVKAVESNISFAISRSCFFTKSFCFDDISTHFNISVDVSYKYKKESSHFISKDFFTNRSLDIIGLFNELKQKIKDERNPELDANINATKYDIILTPDVFASLIDSFVFDLIDYESYVRKSNYLVGFKDLDKKIHIYENPFVNYSPYSLTYDDDFVYAKRMNIIKNGKVAHWKINLNDAYKYKKQVTSNAENDFETNVFVKPGNKPFDELLSNTKKGLLILDVMGLHTTNVTEGALNVVVSAIEIINGKKNRVLKNIAINETITNILKNVELSKETKWISNYNLPYLFSKRIIK